MAAPQPPSPARKAELDDQFSSLYRAHLRDVYSYAYYRVGDHHDAEDLTEQTFLQAYRHFERAQRESKGRPLRPWLIRIAHNLAASYCRARPRRRGWSGDAASGRGSSWPPGCARCGSATAHT